jgi:hypothetical protein
MLGTPFPTIRRLFRLPDREAIEAAYRALPPRPARVAVNGTAPATPKAVAAS